MKLRESITDQIDIYLNMNHERGLSKEQCKHLYELTYNYINVGEDWENEVEKALKQNNFQI